jgi:hypothetical protein
MENQPHHQKIKPYNLEINPGIRAINIVLGNQPYNQEI